MALETVIAPRSIPEWKIDKNLSINYSEVPDIDQVGAGSNSILPPLSVAPDPSLAELTALENTKSLLGDITFNSINIPDMYDINNSSIISREIIKLSILEVRRYSTQVATNNRVVNSIKSPNTLLSSFRFQILSNLSILTSEVLRLIEEDRLRTKEAKVNNKLTTSIAKASMLYKLSYFKSVEEFRPTPEVLFTEESILTAATTEDLAIKAAESFRRLVDTNQPDDILYTAIDGLDYIVSKSKDYNKELASVAIKDLDISLGRLTNYSKILKNINTVFQIKNNINPY